MKQSSASMKPKNKLLPNYYNIEPMSNSENFIVTTFYKFVELEDLTELKLQLLKFCNEVKIKGTILIAKEGINATLTGSKDSIIAFYSFIKSYNCFSDLSFKESISNFTPFKKMKVKIKPEIVTFKAEIDINKRGEYLSPEEWDKFLEKDDIIIIDTRNDYEVALGTFKNATDPKTKAFTELPKWVKENLTEEDKEKTILMFCTGGVRCEKSTAYMKQNGFDKVYHLEGGILKYLESTKNANNNWIGSCFIFDDRSALSHDLTALGSLRNA
ncbi:UPF0176 protein [Candidatus Jidaibacter acanthamoeba]|uniref:tRNA uridine(34) hydroxylase n=1 Tax=Candidatus Jidaibacter acanthamoebae TaxID=86105 RepID=A0A0C1QJ97_9RICK|nr:rhodanese-like domain-containing protein [Candidatus Jidaibacter acanthamoeba]KIE04273.1 UPF0176 protein [Candidatus Jidaibacter acanthamoeba]